MPTAEKLDCLTLQEREIVRMLGKGYPEWHIGERLSLSTWDVRQKMRAIGSKIGADGRLALSIYALGHEL